MEELYETGLTKEQQVIYDRFILRCENSSIIPSVGKVRLVSNAMIARIFLYADEIEEVLSGEEEMFTIEEFRKLRIFRFYLDEKKVRTPYTQRCIEDLYETFFIAQKDIALEEFFAGTEQDWEFNLERYILLFELIEHDYERQTGQPLSFKGLEHKVGYDDWIGF